MSPKRIDLVFSVFSRLIADTMFSICSTPATLKLYTLMIYTGPLYIWIVITIMSKLISCHDHKAGPISLLTIKYIQVTAFGSYKS